MLLFATDAWLGIDGSVSGGSDDFSDRLGVPSAGSGEVFLLSSEQIRSCSGALFQRPSIARNLVRLAERRFVLCRFRHPVLLGIMPTLAKICHMVSDTDVASWKRALPVCLVASRVLLAPVAIWMAIEGFPRWLWLLQMALATLSDVYDGKLARRFGTVTPGLRQADSIADTVYALAVCASLYIAEPEIVMSHLVGIALVIGLEAARYPLDWFRFGRGASYHAWSARIFGVSLIVAVFFAMGFSIGVPFLWIAFGIGVLSELEGIAISLVLPRWTHDVPHLGHALAIRREAGTR